MERTDDDTSRDLLAAAHRLLATDGPSALTVRRIASEAGMSTMNVYSRFGGKDGVTNELFMAGFTMLRERLESVPESADISAELMAAGRAYREFALEHPEYYGVMLGRAVPGFLPSEDASNHALAALAGIVERVERAHNSGQFHLRDGYEPVHAAAFLWAACHGIISLEIANTATESLDWQQVFENGLSATLHSLSNAPSV